MDWGFVYFGTDGVKGLWLTQYPMNTKHWHEMLASRLSGMSPFILDSLACKLLEGELRIIKRSEVHIYRW